MSDTVVIPAGRNSDSDFGKYQFISDLGAGAMGKVCKCFDPDFHRMVAIKTIHKSLLNEGSADEFRERFRNEMRAVGKLTHPNIVSVFDAGEKDGCPYFVMEYVEGQELKHLLDGGLPFTVEQSIFVIKGVLRGLSAVHSQGITHRDLKPANIFISDRDGTPKIADFGIAKLDNSEMTQIGTIIGSPKYMSPEQCMGEPVDARSDLFSIGIIFYELLTGQYCFSADKTSAITQKILNVDPEPPSKLNGTIPRHLDQVIRKALSKRPGDRFQTALEFLDAIDQVKLKKPVKPSGMKKGLAVLGASLVLAGVIFLMTGPFFSTESPESAQSVIKHEQNAPALEEKPSSQGMSNVSQTDINNPQVTALSPEKSAKLAKLFKVAETYKRIGRLVAPAGSNAFDAYNIILSIDPSNTEALAGIAEIKQLLLANARASLEEGDMTQALTIARAGQELFPDSDQFGGIIRSIESR